MTVLEAGAGATAGLSIGSAATADTTAAPADARARWDADRLNAAIIVGDIHTVTLAMVDLHGRLVGKHHSARHFADRILTHGEHVCAYLLASDLTPSDAFESSGWETGYGDMLLMPDPGAVYTLPGRPGEALVFATAIDDGAPVAVSPRRLLTEQVERLAGRGLTARLGVESEYTLIHAPAAEPRPGQPWPGLKPVAYQNADYATWHPRPIEQHRRAVMAAAAAAGLPMEAIKTESGPAQLEVTFAPGDPVQGCDDYTVFKTVARQAAAEWHQDALFMAAPDVDAGNGLHLHLSLSRDGQDVMSSADGELSWTTQCAIAGLLDGLPQLLPLLAPTWNSYRRFRPRSFAPASWCWGYDNRTCAVRITGAPDNVHLEVRVPGADANPYLATAAILGSVTDGIDRELSCPKPVHSNAYADPAAPPIAATLSEALDAFRTGDVPARLFGAAVADHLARAAALEIAGHRDQITDSEVHRAMRA